jgi:hypothetical protein
MDHRHRLRPDDREQALRRAPRPDPDEGSAADSILDLQARAGNQAVTELLAAPAPGAAAPVSLQRDASETGAEPADDRGASGVPRISIPELKLDAPIQSFQRTGSGRKGQGSGDEVVITMESGGADVRLQRAAAEGKSFPLVVITMGRMTMTLHGVVISSAQISNNVSTFTLNFTAIEVDFGPSEDEPRRGGREYGE